MNRIEFAMRRLVRALMLVVALIGVGAFGMYKMRVDVPPLNTTKIYAYLDSMVVRAEQMKERIVSHYESYFHKHDEEEAHHEHHKIVVTSPMAKDVVITQEYVCQIHSRRHIDVRALEGGYLLPILIKEGQAVKEGELMFEILPTLYKARWEAEAAERDLAKLEMDLSQTLANQKGVSQKEVRLFKAKLARAQAKADQAEAELNFTKVKAPFDGIIDRLKEQQGSLIKEGDVLTTLSDNSVMWVYFNVTEKRYLEYMAETGQGHDLRLMSWGDGSGVPASGKGLAIVGIDNKGLLHVRIFGADGNCVTDTDETKLPPTQAAAISALKKRLPDLSPPRVLTSAEKAQLVSEATSIVGQAQSPDIVLMLANHSKFPQIGKIGAIEANFNNETGNIAFRADFPNPDGLLRHGQTGTVLIDRLLKGAMVIPQRATFENLAKRYVYVVNKDDVVHQREIVIEHVLEDIFVIGKELDVNDRIVLEGARQVRDGEKVEYEFLAPEQVMANQKNHAE